MIKSKYIASLNELSKKPVFSSVDGKNAGIPTRMLSYFCSKKQIDRVGRGIYKVKHVDFDRDFEWADLALTALSIPNGVICLISALCLYGLTDEIMREFWVAVPHSTTAPIRENTHIIRMRNTSFGQVSIKIGSQMIKIFDRERTVVDSFRYLDKETALKALQAYLKTKPEIDKLISYGKKLRVNLTPFISAFMLYRS